VFVSDLKIVDKSMSARAESVIHGVFRAHFDLHDELIQKKLTDTLISHQVRAEPVVKRVIRATNVAATRSAPVSLDGTAKPRVLNFFDRPCAIRNKKSTSVPI
jgi:hypothetical protein